jgi:hypothetical protein
MERMTGIEPAYSAWEADVLPLNYTREEHHPSGYHKATCLGPADGDPQASADFHSVVWTE